MRKIKKILLAFCVTAGIATLSACSAPQENAPKELDLGVTSAVSMYSEGILQSVTSVSEDAVDQYIAESRTAPFPWRHIPPGKTLWRTPAAL